MMTRTRISILCCALIVLLLFNCKVGPHYARPSVVENSWAWKNQVVKDSSQEFYQEKKQSFPNQPNQPNQLNRQLTRHDSIAALNPQWWAMFNDSTLNELIQTAFNNNPNLQTGTYRILEQQGLVDIAKSFMYPSLTFTPNVTRSLLSAARPNMVGTGLLPVLNYNTITVPLNFNYTVDVWGRYRRGTESAKATMQASVVDLQLIKLGLASDITSNFLNLRLWDKRVQLYQDAIALRYDNLKLTTSQYVAGITTKLDVAQAQIEVTTVEAQIVDARRNRALAENAIAVLCGVPAMNLQIPTQHELPPVPHVPLEMPSDLLERRPDIKEAEYQIISANAQVGVAKAAFLPSLNLSATSFGYLSSRLENLFATKSQTYLGSVGLSFPIFTGGQNTAQRKVAEARLQEAQSMYKHVVQNAFREVQDALANIEYLTQQAAVQQKALTAAHAAADMSKDLYKNGLTTYINVIIADRAVLDSEIAYIGITGQRLLYSISLIKALGGGWNDDSKQKKN